MRTLLVALLFVVGCEASEAPREMLNGTWYVVVDDTGIGMTFADPETYVLQRVELVSATNANVEIERGTFAWSDHELWFLPQEGTCDIYSPWTANYTVTDSRLTLSGLSGATVMERAPDGPVQVVLRYGCFTSDGFVDHPLAPVVARP